MRRISAVIVATFAVGSGCASPPPEFPHAAVVPTLRIERPANGSATDASSVEVVGRADVPSVIIDGARHAVTDGAFAVPVPLVVGTNVVTVIASNGVATTTQSLRIERFNEP